MLSRGYICFLLSSTFLLFSLGCHSTHTVPSVDRHNPEAVLRAYFDAWANNDHDTQTSFMSPKYNQLANEPVESLRVLSIAPADKGSATTRVFSVSFEVKLKGGQSVSMQDGRYVWTYTLQWDERHDSWVISNYGAG